jgi:hypothetical protein
MTNTKTFSRFPHVPWPSELDRTYEQLDLLPAVPVRPRVTYTPSRLPTPILAMDVDGPLNVSGQKLRSGFRSIAWRDDVSYRAGSTWIPHSRLHLSRKHGDMLSAFSREHDVELVWASLWEHNANRVIGPALGLPRLPWVDFHGHAAGRQFWKFPAMADFAAGRPLVWLDDSFTRKARQRRASGFDRARRGLPTLLMEIDPYIGMTRSNLDDVAGWLSTARLAW